MAPHNSHRSSDPRKPEDKFPVTTSPGSDGVRKRLLQEGRGHERGGGRFREAAAGALGWAKEAHDPLRTVKGPGKVCRVRPIRLAWDAGYPSV